MSIRASSHDKASSFDTRAHSVRHSADGKGMYVTTPGSGDVQDRLVALDAYATALEAYVAQLRERAKSVIVDGQYNDVMRMSDLLRHVAEAEMRSENPFLLAVRGFRGRSEKRNNALRRMLLYVHYRYLKSRPDAGTIVKVIESGFFDRKFYLTHNKDVARAGVDPVLHFLDHGGKEARSPSSRFDVPFYLRHYPDVESERENPLVHFLRFGLSDGYLPLAPDDFLSERNWKLPVRPAAIKPRPPVKTVVPEAVVEAPAAPKIVVYTAVAGGYDHLSAMKLQFPGVKFVVFRDDLDEVSGWEARPFNFFHKDPTRMARFVKLHPHLYFSEYDISVWIDANIFVKGNLKELIDKVRDDDVVGIFHHPLRNCIYLEGEECIKRSKDASDSIERQVEKYRIEGHPAKAGLWETNVVVRRHNDPRCQSLMKEWWKEIELGSRRDQLSLPVAALRTGVEIVPLGRKRENARDHKIVGLVAHPPRRTKTAAGSPKYLQKPVDLSSKSVVIGICVHNALDEVKDCLNSISASALDRMRVVLVDDASGDETADYLKGFAKRHSFVKLIRNDSNKGYTKSANLVLANGGDDWTVVLNSDTVLGRNSINRLISAGEQFNEIGVIGAMSNAASWQSVPRLTGDDGKFCINQIPDGMTVDDMGEICAAAGANEVAFVPLVNGFCFAVHRRTIDAIGSFDEEHFPMGYGEEDDFCLRAGDHGLTCALALSAYVFHAKSATFTAERRIPLVAEGAAALRKKHGEERLKAAVQYLRHHPRLMRLREDFATLQEKAASLHAPRRMTIDDHPLPAWQVPKDSSTLLSL